MSEADADRTWSTHSWTDNIFKVDWHDDIASLHRNEALPSVSTDVMDLASRVGDATCAGELQDGFSIQDLCRQVVQSQGPHAAEHPDIALQLL